MTTSILLAAAAVLVATGLVAWNTFHGATWHNPSPSMTSFYDLQAETLEGEAFSFESLQGKRVLIVNTASKCGYTPQYEPLEELHKRYANKGLVILGFPCNQFGRQEPGSANDIREFCTRNYGVSFQMMSKVDVKGDNQHPVYAWLTQQSLNGAGDHKVRWNFHKFLVNENGELVAALGSGADPLGEEVLAFAEGR
ncbi:MAG: glutathione peroxidase [Flavobacteriales bacterium]